MLRILIADDEFVERDGIIFLINKFSFELDIKECSDGEEALNYIKENTVDILFTDVKMPFLDGLQLSKKAREIYPNLKIVIFSGFGEFEYAKRAIDIGVSDYILKPINPKEFKETMEKVINDVNEEKKENKNNELRQFREKEYILLKIISGSSIDDLKEKFFMDKHIDFMDKYKNMILMEFDDEFFNDNQKYMEEIRNNIDIKIDYLNLNPQQSIIFTFETIEEEELKNILIKVHNRIFNDYEINCYFAVSNLLKSSYTLTKEYSNIEQLMEQRFFIANNYVFFYDSKLQLESTDEKFDDTMFKNIQYDIKSRDFFSLRKHVDCLIRKYGSHKSFSQMYVKFILSNIYKEVYEEIRKVNETDLNEKIDKIYFCRTIQEISEILNNIINKLEEQSSKGMSNERHDVEMVKNYIYKNYGSDLSLEKLAEYVYMTPSYLSSIFKKTTNMGINNFIKNYRMEKARDMLENTNIRIKDIGNRVGYTNISYFCQSFREFYGLTPEKYRQRDETNE